MPKSVVVPPSFPGIGSFKEDYSQTNSGGSIIVNTAAKDSVLLVQQLGEKTREIQILKNENMNLNDRLKAAEESIQRLQEMFYEGQSYSSRQQHQANQKRGFYPHFKSDDLGKGLFAKGGYGRGSVGYAQEELRIAGRQEKEEEVVQGKVKQKSFDLTA